LIEGMVSGLAIRLGKGEVCLQYQGLALAAACTECVDDCLDLVTRLIDRDQPVGPAACSGRV